MFTLTVNQEIELQLFQLHHSLELFELVDSNRLYLRAWLPWVDGMKSPDQYPAIIQMWLRQFADNNGYNLGIRYKGKLVGTISLHAVDWRNSQASVGYYLSEKMQGNGIMTKAVEAVIQHAFLQLGLNRIEIRCGKENHKSQAIPARLGFTFEGVIREGEFLNGSFHDLVVFGMLSKEWSFK